MTRNYILIRTKNYIIITFYSTGVSPLKEPSLSPSIIYAFTQSGLQLIFNTFFNTD